MAESTRNESANGPRDAESSAVSQGVAEPCGGPVFDVPLKPREMADAMWNLARLDGYAKTNSVMRHATVGLGVSHAGGVTVARFVDYSAHGPGQPPSASDGASASGFLGGAALAEALGVHPSRRDAFHKLLERQRMSLGDDCWQEVRDPRPNCPRFISRVDSPALRALAERYRKPKPA